MGDTVGWAVGGVGALVGDSVGTVGAGVGLRVFFLHSPKCLPSGVINLLPELPSALSMKEQVAQYFFLHFHLLYLVHWSNTVVGVSVGASVGDSDCVGALDGDSDGVSDGDIVVGVVGAIVWPPT